jgi:hypothetical protein
VSVNADFLSLLSGLRLYRVFATRDTNRSSFQPRYTRCRNTEPRSHSLVTLLLARLNNSYVSSQCPRRQNVDTLHLLPHHQLLWPTLSAQSSGLHVSLYRDFCFEELESRLMNSRYANPRVEPMVLAILINGPALLEILTSPRSHGNFPVPR